MLEDSICSEDDANTGTDIEGRGEGVDGACDVCGGRGEIGGMGDVKDGSSGGGPGHALSKSWTDIVRSIDRFADAVAPEGFADSCSSAFKSRLVIL